MSATVVEWIGYAASALILVSLLMTSVVRLRVINAVGAAVFTWYGLLIDSPPVWGANAAILLIDLWQLWVLTRGSDERVVALEVPWDSPVLGRVLEVHADDVARFAAPGFSGPTSAHRAWLVLRDETPTSALLARSDDGRVLVDLDWATPATRDLRAGQLLHHDLDVLAGVGPGPVVAHAGPSEHARYLRDVGFTRDDDGRWTREPTATG